MSALQPCTMTSCHVVLFSLPGWLKSQQWGGRWLTSVIPKHLLLPLFQQRGPQLVSISSKNPPVSLPCPGLHLDGSGREIVQHRLF